MVLVTGATGLVGSHLLMELVRSGQPVRALHRMESDLERVRNLFAWTDPALEGAWGQIDWFEADISDIPALEAAFEGVEKVFHCAGYISFDPADRSLLQKVNFEGTRNVVNTCLAFGVRRLCHVSSIATIGGHGMPVTEEDPWDPARTNVYSTSKYLAEMEAWRGSQEGLETVIVNPGVILGTGQYEEGSGRLFEAVHRGLRYYPPGATGFVTVGDVVRAMCGLMESGHSGERYILVNENLTYRELLGRIARAFGRKPPSRTLRFWQFHLLRSLDWIRSMLTGSKRKLTGAGIRGLRDPKEYVNGKILDALPGYRYEDLNAVINACIRHFRESRSEA
ncbi:NAD-dependent epimerase/dehydratase family protein [Robiginitalea sp. SC105]|uniref:NAD-dependent epimerase/dehydratase family protein n=1 Tax=Robiginitalea sp. SC105 TaxID=2762332 RepID=UPI00163B46BC|nr:NAD-dependent epimerase/dehydratase family protein [Robiginitalea sp. SC105]MBC2837906.1 NAD-dependent epimerase/dehydratase family protein [Robiginitalea sp. SC105]